MDIGAARVIGTISGERGGGHGITMASNPGRAPKRASDTCGRRIALISGTASSLHNFRGDLIEAMTGAGHVVFGLAPDFRSFDRRKLEEVDARPVAYSLSRTGTNPLRDLRDTWALSRLLSRLSLDYTLAYFAKPVIYGSLAAWLAGVPRRYSMIAGLGILANEKGNHGGGFGKPLLRTVLPRFYQSVFTLNERVFFQNGDNMERFIRERIVSRSKAVRIRGSGVNLDRFAPSSSVTNPVTFLLMARLLVPKGVREYARAARHVKQEHPHARFLLLGQSDENPESIEEDEVQGWVEEGLLEWPGYVDDVRPWLEKTSVYVLPSYYGEGVPRSVLEAMAMARPVITTDVSGCRETVVDGKNGFLVPARDVSSLANAMSAFLERPDRIPEMGRSSREMAEQQFDVRHVNRVILEAMGLTGQLVVY